jgi:hypothetical protein
MAVLVEIVDRLYAVNAQEVSNVSHRQIMRPAGDLDGGSDGEPAWSSLTRNKHVIGTSGRNLL